MIFFTWILSFVFSLSLLAADSNVSGEYILSSSITTSEGEIKQIFKEKMTLKKLSQTTYLIRFKKDPGLAILQKRLTKKPYTIQPNFKYQANPGTSGQIQNKLQL